MALPTSSVDAFPPSPQPARRGGGESVSPRRPDMFFVGAHFAFRDDAGNLRLNLQRDIFGFAGCLVDDDKVTAIVATELLVRVQKLGAIARTIWRNVHVE
jgi:hypothetical protein